jgi:uncharacterized membrane protein (DUF485 family)
VESFGVLIGAVLGGAGVSGVIAGLVQLTRAARATRSIDQLKKSRDGQSKGPGVDALQAALDLEQLRLASLSVVRIPQVILVPLVALLFFVVIVLFAGYDPDASAVEGNVNLVDTPLWQVVAFVVLYVLAPVYVVDATLQWRRNQFVTAALNPGADIQALTRVWRYESRGKRRSRSR